MTQLTHLRFNASTHFHLWACFNDLNEPNDPNGKKVKEFNYVPENPELMTSEDVTPEPFILYVAMDQSYISRDTFDGIYQQADKTAKMISGLISYLRKNEELYKQSKRKKPEKPKKP